MTNARKSRELHRQEELERQEELMKREQLIQMRESFQVFACSGTQQHDNSCDGSCEIVALEGLDLEIAKELRKWDEVGMVAVGSIPGSPFPGVPVNTLDLEIKFVALMKVIQSKMDISDDELNEVYRQLKLERFTAIREANEQAIMSARARAQVAIPDKPGIVLPPGIIGKMQ